MRGVRVARSHRDVTRVGAGVRRASCRVRRDVPPVHAAGRGSPGLRIDASLFWVVRFREFWDGTKATKKLPLLCSRVVARGVQMHVRAEVDNEGK